jgi:hypothetical protein
MKKTPIIRAIEASIITAFTIAAAFIWKDVILDFIQFVVPPKEQLLYKFFTALFSTAVLAAAIYVIIQTESEAELVMKRIRKK